MRGALIHGVLLAVMLVYGYRTWTRDTSTKPTIGTVVLWDRAESDIVSIEYKSDKKEVKIERKGTGADAYWWGTATTTTTEKKKPSDPLAGSDAAADTEVKKVSEFPLGDAATDLITRYTAARALRDLGASNEKQLKDDKLADSKSSVTVTFKDGARTFTVGGPVYGSADKYALDTKSNKIYILAKELLSGLEGGESTLQLVDPRGFVLDNIDEVTITAGDHSRVARRVTKAGEDGKAVKTWGDADSKKANQTVANYIEAANNLKPTAYQSDVKMTELTPIVAFGYRDAKGGKLGTMTLYRHEKPGVLPDGAELDPANPPKGEIEYFVVTEKSRVPGLVKKDAAQRTEQDLEAVFTAKADEETGAGSGSGSGAGSGLGAKSLDPKGNPFTGPGAKNALPPAPRAPEKPAGGGSAAPAPAPGAGSSAPAPAPAPAPAKAPAPAPAALKAPAPAPAAAGSGSAH